MHCRICGKKSGKGRVCDNCSYLLKNGADEETIRRVLSDDATKKVWEENEKISEELADAYYDELIKDYKKVSRNDSKENFGYNTFADGIRLGFDIVTPLLDETMQLRVKEKVKQMLTRSAERKGGDSLWSKGYFAQSMSGEEMEQKKKTIHMKHDEDMNYNCKSCNKKISAHNRDWHNNMCDDCFNKKYFPEDAQVYETDVKRIKIECRSNPNQRENQKFCEFLKSDEFNQERFQKIVREITEKIDCTICANCCKVLKSALNEQDVERISKHLNLAKDEFILKYLIRNDGNEMEINQLPCHFLADNKCQIYEIRPEACRGYPNLDKEVTVRCHAFLSNAEICLIAFNVLENAKEEFLEEIYAFENPDI